MIVVEFERIDKCRRRVTGRTVGIFFLRLFWKTFIYAETWKRKFCDEIFSFGTQTHELSKVVVMVRGLAWLSAGGENGNIERGKRRRQGHWYQKHRMIVYGFEISSIVFVGIIHDIIYE